MIKTTTARLCCDVDVGAIGFNLVGFIDEKRLYISGIALPEDPRRVSSIVDFVTSDPRITNRSSPDEFSMIYIDKQGWGVIGERLVYEDKLFQGGLMRKIYLEDSRRVIGYILNNIVNYTPRVVGYADSVKGSRSGKINNDDAVLVMGVSYCHGGVERSIHIIAVADGVSSLGSGFRASAAAIRRFVAEITSRAYMEQQIDAQDVKEAYVETARELIELNREGNSTSATTLTATVYPVNGLLLVVHVGDTRAYIFKNGRLVRLTEDHKIQGTSVITRSLGIALHDPQITATFFEPGSTLILASDGLYEVVREDEIINVLLNKHPPTLVVKDLIEKVIERRGEDDASIAIARRLL